MEIKDTILKDVKRELVEAKKEAESWSFSNSVSYGDYMEAYIEEERAKRSSETY